MEEFRPISLLPTIGKIFESIIAKIINLWAEEKEVLNDEQSGFRANRSTQDNIFHHIQSIFQRQNRNTNVSSIFIDFEKAFDKININYLLFKFNNLEIPKYILNILYSYLDQRKAFVEVNKFQYSTFTIKGGVPQGSCLSPILFGLFVSDIPTSKSCDLSQFANDLATWYVRNKKATKLFNDYITEINTWCKKWGLNLNKLKTKNLNTGNHNTIYKIDGTKLENVKEIIIANKIIS